MKLDPIHLGGLNWEKLIGRQDKQIGGHRVYVFMAANVLEVIPTVNWRLVRDHFLKGRADI